MITQVLRGVVMHPLYEAVQIPFARQLIGEDGSLSPNDSMPRAARALLDALVRLEAALRPLR
jgi:hypothetical protein